VNPGARLIVLGKQGAGKGTQAVRLSHHYVVPHISTGDVLRAAVRSRSALGKQANLYVDAGELVPDEIVIGIVRERLTQDTSTLRGFVLDGFPRTVHQAESLGEILSPRGLDLVIDLEVDTEHVLRRLAARRVCVDCGTNYSMINNPPRVGGICDVCGGEVVQREDDTEAAIKRRLELYQHETAPLVAYYRREQLLEEIDGLGTPDEVTDRVVAAVDRRKVALVAQHQALLAERPDLGIEHGR
jgi:adenylate kinase